jgi:hypothetical protein
MKRNGLANLVSITRPVPQMGNHAGIVIQSLNILTATRRWTIVKLNDKEPSVYYILVRNVNDARRRFRERYSWLSIVLVRHVDPAGAESVLTDYKKMPG